MQEEKLKWQESKEESQKRFTMELEFVQLLGYPPYLKRIRSKK